MFSISLVTIDSALAKGGNNIMSVVVEIISQINFTYDDKACSKQPGSVEDQYRGSFDFIFIGVRLSPRSGYALPGVRQDDFNRCRYFIGQSVVAFLRILTATCVDRRQRCRNHQKDNFFHLV